ncbi:hypothetical protein Ade02nite_36210 [Paractinoplanes deccanensis]|uniref:HTH luxR-type domain-containing protein n=1 Tax=Paractinoplanes deccanensis TaxID=113561 RepID=A0ABQ3Y4S2_9ACTN|nr:helix-turn-helix transcriptional regulator [Actinoplanes deccanensis]GID74980.1 hypothetical protein Ade02nite_36210 [Actinoplanes deccanensis]
MLSERTLAAEISAVATLAAGPEERARALLEPVRRLMAFDAAAVTLFDPVGRRQVTLAREGYPEKMRQYMRGVEFAVDLETVGLRRNALPVRVEDVPVPPETVPVWRDYLLPAGFGDGFGVGLFTSDGRFLGSLIANSESAPLSDENRMVLHRLVPLIAHAVDPLRTVSALAEVVADAVAGRVLTRAGETLELAGLPGHRLLTPDSPTTRAALAVLAEGQVSGSFLCPDGDRVVRVTALACPPQPPGHLRAVLLISPPPGTGLTRRELQVLGLLIEGYTNAGIAEALYVTVRTAVTHIEHVMAKLGVTSRTVAATRALRAGLYIPASVFLPIRKAGAVPQAGVHGNAGHERPQG